MYTWPMPRLWSETIESHRSEVREAILASTAELASDHGPFNVTMSQIAETVGVSRATLYKYFPSVEDILDAWHERHINHHLERLQAAAAGDEPPIERLTAVLRDYAEIQRNRSNHAASGRGLELATFLHRPDGAAQAATQKIHQLIADLIADSATHGEIRNDLYPDELTHYCLRALDAASQMKTKAATRRLVDLILTALRLSSGSA